MLGFKSQNKQWYWFKLSINFPFSKQKYISFHLFLVNFESGYIILDKACKLTFVFVLKCKGKRYFHSWCLSNCFMIDLSIYNWQTFWRESIYYSKAGSIKQSNCFSFKLNIAFTINLLFIEMVTSVGTQFTLIFNRIRCNWSITWIASTKFRWKGKVRLNIFTLRLRKTKLTKEKIIFNRLKTLFQAISSRKCETAENLMIRVQPDIASNYPHFEGSIC